MMVGPDLLVAPVFEPGARQRASSTCRATRDTGWFEVDTGALARRRADGSSVAAPLDRLPLFVRGGAVLPTTLPARRRARTEEPSRRAALLPAPREWPGTARPLLDRGRRALARVARRRTHARTAADDVGRRDVRLDVRREAGHCALPPAQIRVVAAARRPAPRRARTREGLGATLVRT